VENLFFISKLSLSGEQNPSTLSLLDKLWVIGVFQQLLILDHQVAVFCLCPQQLLDFDELALQFCCALLVDLHEWLVDGDDDLLLASHVQSGVDGRQWVLTVGQQGRKRPVWVSHRVTLLTRTPVFGMVFTQIIS